MKKIISIVLGFILALSMVGCGSGMKDEVPENAAYLITFSSMFKQVGGYYYVSAEGDILGKSTRLKVQDLYRFEVSEDRIILSGERHNNTLLFTRNSSIPNKDFIFLSNSKGTGVTAVASNGENVLGIMNGSFSDNVYKNLFVLQNLSGEVLTQYTLDIFAHKVLYFEEKAIIAGAYLEMQSSSMLSVAELLDCTDEDIKTYQYDEYKGFWDVVSYNGVLYCLAERKNENRDTVVMIDANDYSIIAESTLSDELVNLFVHNDSVYAVGNKGLYIVTSLDESVEQRIGFDPTLRVNDAYAYFAYELDGKAYVFLRYQQRQKENNDYIYGNMVQIDLDDAHMEVTQIKSNGKNKVDNIFIIPASFVR